MALRISCILLLLQGVDSKNFYSVRLPNMNDYIPPTDHVKAFSMEECAVHCINDVTCASYSHSDQKERCYLSPFVFTSEYKDVIQQATGHGYRNFILNEFHGIQLLQTGFRIHESESFAVRYQYFRPVNKLNALHTCIKYGGTLAVLDTLQKWKAVQMDIKGNKDLTARHVSTDVKVNVTSRHVFLKGIALEVVAL
ncbi:uncharacterized protein LOC121387438 [Gigantopelta aegis]|uniref:uncharacterized protein LOC121387438 n=1 Tax=Gigantopelta aegis TaxID=1735272 RepID=UPI001B88A6A2|nr:uncharacterized protein LOC121387438 [Gigantopelta aegis]